MRDAAVAVNGSRHAVPFALESGEYAEPEGTVWTRYSEGGEPMERKVAAVNSVMFRNGKNECRLQVDDDTARAEISLFALGTPIPALKPIDAMSEESRRILSYEAASPVVYAPSRGMDCTFPVMMRPGEKAQLEFEIHGPVVDPVLSVQSQDGKTETVEFKTALSEGERLICRDGKTWKVVTDFRAVRTGMLSKPLPGFSGVCRIEMKSYDPATAHARINVIKRYGSPKGKIE